MCAHMCACMCYKTCMCTCVWVEGLNNLGGSTFLLNERGCVTPPVVIPDCVRGVGRVVESLLLQSDNFCTNLGGAYTRPHTSLGAPVRAHTSLVAHTSANTSLGAQQTSAYQTLGAQTSAHTSLGTHTSLGVHTSACMCAFPPWIITPVQW